MAARGLELELELAAPAPGTSRPSRRDPLLQRKTRPQEGVGKLERVFFSRTQGWWSLPKGGGPGLLFKPGGGGSPTHTAQHGPPEGWQGDLHKK